MIFIRKYIKKQTLVIGISIISLLIIAISTSYALFSVQEKVDMIVQVGNFKVTFTGSNIIDFGSQIGDPYCEIEDNKNNPECTGIIPQKDEDGKNQSGYNFTILNDSNQSTLPAKYTVYIDTKTDYFNGVCDEENPNYNQTQCQVLTDRLVPHKYIKFELTKNNNIINEGTLECLTFEDVANNNVLPCLNNNILAEGILDPSDIDEYTLKVWLIHYEEETASGIMKTLPPNDIVNKEIHLEINVEAEVEMENIIVDIVDNMIPITWNEDKWVKTSPSNTNNEWYDYDNQKWANSVLVTTESREQYKDANIGTSILEEDILAYYVYVPRYRYQLWNTNHNENCLNDNCAEQEINIKFETKYKEKALGAQNGEWLTHPAFTFGGSELNGIWVGKFTTSVDETTNCYSSPSTANCNNKDHTPRVKPNKDMWRYTQVSTMFSVSKRIETQSMYGLTTYDNIDSHMMKNMEWGATAYLYHSKYGKYGNEDFTGANKRLYVNNYRGPSADAYKTETGCSAGAPNKTWDISSCPHPYPLQTLEATGASTTGNIYGIYDMSGRVYEYVMGNMVESSSPLGALNIGSSGTWDYIPDSKYFESYAYDTDPLSHERGYLGDSMKEVLLEFGKNNNGGWYGNVSAIVSDYFVWVIRGSGGSIVAQTGPFAFARGSGNTTSYSGFRLVLVLE